MVKRMFSILAALLMVAGAAIPSAQAALSAVGTPVAPHGYPSFYSDGAIALEPCLPANQFGTETTVGGDVQVPVGNSTRPDLCIFDAINPANPESVKLGVGDESFWWMGDAVMNLPTGGRAVLVLGLEGAFGGVGSPADGQQIAFGRVRIRVDTPTTGVYTVNHPFGTETFTVTDAAGGINFTSDIGAINQLTPALGFSGALNAAFGPFLTWPNYLADETLKVRDLDPLTGLPTGAVLEQYIGDPNVPHIVTGGINGNIFRVQGPNNFDAQTNLFNVMGKIYDPSTPIDHIFPDAPLANLFAVGPINRDQTVDFLVDSAPAMVEGGEVSPYPVGFPIWIQDTDVTVVETVEQRAGGLQLTYCPPTDAMCISAPIDPLDANSVALRVGEEGFFWTAEAFINADTADVANLPAGIDGILVQAIEGAFITGGPQDMQQILFARIRIRVDVPVAGTYTITYPYGTEVFDNVTVADGINFTSDVMISDPLNPDQSFIGAIYGAIGPKFLTWTSFDPTLAANDPQLQRLSDPTNLASPVIHYIGDPGIEHAVTGSPTNNNLFRIQGPNGIDVQTALFAVTGKVYDPATFNLAINPALPVATADAETLTLPEPSVTINILANDTEPGPVQATAANVNAAIVTAPSAGTAVVNANDTITYTPGAAIAANGGTDTFTYNIAVAATPLLISNTAEVTVTVIPVGTIAFTQARLDLRKLRLELSGTSNLEGSTLTIGNTASGAVLGTATVTGGRWSFRGTVTTRVNSVTLVANNPAATTVTQPLQVR